MRRVLGVYTMRTFQKKETEGAIWARLLEPDKPNLTPAAARCFLDLHFSEADTERMRHLAANARAGNLTAAEREEIDVYGRVGSLLSILKSKARKSLKLRSPSNGSNRRKKNATRS